MPHLVPCLHAGDALLQLRNSITSDPFRLLSSWTAGSHPCGSDGTAAWQGVMCDAPEGRVQEVDLSSSRMVGFLVPDITSLSHLRKL